jgi:hypothetical protein
MSQTGAESLYVDRRSPSPPGLYRQIRGSILRHAKTDKTDAWHLRSLLAEGRPPECWIPSAHILEYRALLETYHDLRTQHTAWVQRIHAVFFHRGAPRLGEDALRTEQGLAGLRAAAAAHLSPAGSSRWPPPWTCSPLWKLSCSRCASSSPRPPGT